MSGANMATRSLGTLTIDLIAKVGGFVAGMNQAERASDDWRRQVEKNVKSAGKAMAGAGAAVAAAAVGIGAAALSMTRSVSDSVMETDRWAKSLGISTTELQKWQFAASKAGVEGDNIADIFKDLNDKIGDAVLNKSGEAAQALDTLGLSAKKLQNVSPDKQLLAISSAMKGMNTAQKTTIYEALGNDLSKLIPLLDNGAQGFQKLAKQATDSGVALPQEDIDKLLKFNLAIQDIETSWDGFKNKMAVGLSQIDLTGLVKSVNDMEKVFTDPKVLQGIASLVSQVAELAGWLAKIASAAGTLAATTNTRVAALGGNIDIGNIEQVGERIKVLQDDIANRGSGFYSGGQTFVGWLMDVDDSVQKSKDELTKLLVVKDKLQKNVKIPALPLIPATIGKPEDFKLGAGETNGQQKKPKVSKLDNSFKAAELAYQRQIALIDVTGDKTVEVSEQQKLAFDIADGKLTGLNSKQKERLQQLATEIDRLESLKKANEENLKLLSFVDNLRSTNVNQKKLLDTDFIGSGMGEKTRARMKELLSIQQDFLQKQSELQSKYQSREITKSLYDKETTALQSALNERLDIQEQYYKKADKKRDDWQGGIKDTFADFADKSSDYYQVAADAMTSIMGSATSSISDNLYSILEGSESLVDGIKNVFADLGEAVVKALVDMAAQWLVYQGVQLLVGKTAQVSAVSSMVSTAQATALQAQLAAYASTAAIPIVGPELAPVAMATAAGITTPIAAAISAVSLTGMAHDGIDSVPETGTWLLQQGERVVTSQTSSKLDATLDRVSRDASGAGTYAPVTHISVTGDPDKSTLKAIENAVARGEKRVYGRMTAEAVKPHGQFGNALHGNYSRKTPR